jgi:hypothetical protein
MSWENVARLSELTQVNMELAIAWLDDCIRYSQKAIEYLEKSGYLLKKYRNEFNHEAPGQRRDIPACRQQGKQ